MRLAQSAAFGPETVALLRNVLDQAWGSLAPERRKQTRRSEVAERILKAAAEGERDPHRLLAHAVTEVVACND